MPNKETQTGAKIHRKVPIVMILRSVEIFSGAGGLALGIARAGFEHLAVVEWDGDACRTMRENQGRVKEMRIWPVHHCDVRDFDFTSLPEGIELLAGGVPCQPFSIGGKHLGQEDERNMFPELISAVRKLRPKAVLVENVRGLARPSFAKYFGYIELMLTYPEITRRPAEEWASHRARLEKHHTGGIYRGLNYKVVHQVLNAADYGSPQKRERLFLVAIRADLGVEWTFPQPTHSFESMLWDQYISQEYWERHGVSKRARPELSYSLAARIDNLKRTSSPLLTASWRTVRDAICSLSDPYPKRGKGGRAWGTRRRKYGGYAKWRRQVFYDQGELPTSNIPGRVHLHGLLDRKHATNRKCRPSRSCVSPSCKSQVRAWRSNPPLERGLMPFCAYFDIDLPRALREQLVEALGKIGTGALTIENLAEIPTKRGVYQLYQGDELVYVGKADKLRSRLTKHLRKIQGRTNLAISDMSFKCLWMSPNWITLAPESQLIALYKEKNMAIWNGNGFGPNDPGAGREDRNKPPALFDELYPIRESWPCNSISAGPWKMRLLLTSMKKTLPYLLRFENSKVYDDLSVEVPEAAMPASDLLGAIAAALPPGWQATRFPSHMILYNKIRSFQYGTVIYPS